MAGIFDAVRSLFGCARPRPVVDTGEVERIGAEFRRRHTNFRLLLTAGKRLLSTLSDMERATTDGRVFGMTFLRAGSTAIIVNAFRMIKHLEALAPTSAGHLKPCFHDLSARVEEVLGRRKAPVCGVLVADISTLDAAQADLMGARLAELGDIKNRLGLPVPQGFVVGACAYELFASQPGLREEMARRIQTLYDAGSQTGDDEALADRIPAIYGADDAALKAMSREIQALILAAPLPDELAQAITSACDGLMRACGETHLCVLPVSLGEGQGFTGSYPAQFSVPCGDALDAYRRAVAGKYSSQAMARRLSRGIADIDVSLCVGMLAVPESATRGTCNSSNPAASAQAAGLEPEDAARLAELARKLQEGLGAPARFEWLQGPDGAFSLLRCGPEPASDDQSQKSEAEQGDEAMVSPVGRSHMEGSPVHARLCELLELLSPLTLPAPEDPGFRAANCRTVRDVARLAHQRGVDAMFDFGRSQQDFSERQAKQLWAGGAAMQWWIINLEDAFSAAPEGKFIRLENIDSPPFLAVWEGISAFPWAGPPPIDARGFLSIMYESTTNPEISITGGFDFGVQNHILLSKAYVSLSSRFGYHFVTIEALVGERARENFVSFQFRGGAAERTRRARRIAFVSGLLKEFGFGIDVNEDALIARVEGLTTSELMDRLRVLGYLIIHTRQLDMIMRIPAQVRLHREKILREIGEMLARPVQSPSEKD
ncbi:MAG: PEP/pyruvate-binding domain-containing protein [Humidesulfovibrio sp.]|uniref:PEP/pyruvate-binding domain-containing protein n=1 Tax=Humidesulfovibrio sp. TaxID=2910988 RepID=UPI002734EC85|nr:PEP/pyruvate-binding domain-containing protein [Humidesulfovibrio sp.]MDP2849214.1 PEP/pyruvate-binding domain-containing protein [Humidesulfovibrio sp.]